MSKTSSCYELDTFQRQQQNKTRGDTLDRLPVYTSQQVAQHDGIRSSRVWMSYGGYVYDVTDFIPLHPGGTARITRATGAAMEPYWYFHTQHFRTEQPLEILNTLVIGRLNDTDQERIDKETEVLQEQLDSFQLECQITTKTNKGNRRSFQFSLEDLQTLPRTDRVTRIGCPSSSSSQSNKKESSTPVIFVGVLLRDLLKEMQVSPNFQGTVSFEALDGEIVSVDIRNGGIIDTTSPTTTAGGSDKENDNEDDNQILVAYEENGAPLTQSRGFPLRVIIPNKRVIKWVKRIQVS
jgi:cytochrome b involved in lipid metabolism